MSNQNYTYTTTYDEDGTVWVHCKFYTNEVTEQVRDTNLRVPMIDLINQEQS